MFERLPTVHNCCCCISLKVGCIIIGILTLLSVLDCVLGGTAQLMEKCKDTSILKIFVYVHYGISAMLVVLSILYLYGIFAGKSDTSVLFMWGLVITIIFQIAYATVLFVFGKKCSLGYTVGGSLIVGILISIYFLIVVNSYHQEF